MLERANIIASEKEKINLIKNLEEELSKHESWVVNQNQTVVERILRENFELKQRLTVIGDNQVDSKKRISLKPSDSAIGNNVVSLRSDELERENMKLREENKNLSRIMEEHSNGKLKYIYELFRLDFSMMIFEKLYKVTRESTLFFIYFF